jgi:hypothetical protein
VGEAMTIVVGARVRRNDRRFPDVGTVVRVEAAHVVVHWDHGRLRLTSVSLGDIKPPSRPRQSRYTLVEQAEVA